jgi:hypothetical protein
LIVPLYVRVDRHSVVSFLDGQILNDVAFANPAHKNVVTVLVSATPFSLLTAHSRVPRFAAVIPAASAATGAGSSSTSPGPGLVLKNLDVQTLGETAVIQDVHVVDWSDKELEAFSDSDSGKTPHLRCYRLRCYRGIRESGYWYVDCIRSIDGPPALAAVLRDDADLGGCRFTITASSLLDPGLARLTVEFEGTAFSLIVVPPTPESPTPRLQLTPAEAGPGTEFQALLGMGVGVVSFAWRSPGNDDASWLISAPLLDAAHSDVLELASAPVGAPPLRARFCLSQTDSRTKSYKSVGFLLNTIRHAEKEVSRFRYDQHFPATSQVLCTTFVLVLFDC